MNVYWCKDTSNDNFKKLAKFLWQGIMPGEWKPSSEEAMEKSLKSFCKAIKNVRPYSFTLVQNFDLGKGNYMSLWDFS